MSEKREIEYNTFYKWGFWILLILFVGSLLGYFSFIQKGINKTHIPQKLHKNVDQNGTSFYEEDKSTYEENKDLLGNEKKTVEPYQIVLPSNKFVIKKEISPREFALRFHVNLDDFYASNPNLDPNNDQATKPTEPNQDIPNNVVNVPTNDSTMSEYEKEVVALTNKARVNAGLKPLTADTGNLQKSARAKSDDMAKYNYFDHNSRTWGSPFDEMKQMGVTYTSASENIASGQKTPSEVVNSWLNSAGHRANIMNASFNRIGVGYAISKDGKTYWTQQIIQK